jgi:glycosyltransferase involved in cell wall biosynthesis
MPSYLNAADALLLTSKREGSPNTVKEAMACNVPVVATDVGDVRQRLEGVTGSYVCQTDEELVEALACVLECEEESNGRDTIRDLSVEGMGTEIKRIYETILG